MTGCPNGCARPYTADIAFVGRRPDVYHIFVGGGMGGDRVVDLFAGDVKTEDLVATLLRNFGAKLTPTLRAKAAEEGRPLFDVVTMASIVEAEVRGDEDRRMVADIFWRRLDVGMALQADSTVNYVTGKGHASVSLEDTEVESRYNTYKYPGLPFGPICNPGLSAIKAAVDPKPNAYWYFLTDKEGTVHYGKTLDEHNTNKAIYLK
jgi:UPF0755 protein